MKSYISKTLTEQTSKQYSFAMASHHHLQSELLSGCKCHLEYAQFEKWIAEAKGIIIVGWTYPKFISPSHFKKIADIKKLYDAIWASDCKAIKLSQQEWDECVAANVSLAALVEYLPKTSASKKCKALDMCEEEEGEEEEEEMVIDTWGKVTINHCHPIQYYNV